MVRTNYDEEFFSDTENVMIEEITITPESLQKDSEIRLVFSKKAEIKFGDAEDGV